MPDHLTTVGLGAIAAYLGKDGLEKLLGPTAEYLGEGLRDLAQKRIENIGKILQNAEKKAGAKLNSPGKVPPRVLKTVLSEGSFCDDVLAAEYFGGVLASSRTEQGRDDRGARLAKILDSLSSYQIRAHYLIYSTIRQLFSASGLPFNMEGRPKMEIFLPFGDFAAAMDFDQTELRQYGQLLNHIFFGLSAEDLIGGNRWQYGPKESILKLYPKATDGGIVCQPSAFGAELYLWAFGEADKPLEYVFDTAFTTEVQGIDAGVPGAAATKGATDE